MFRFQQFTIHDDRCAMKVGTDGVLLGAWAQLGGIQSAMDVGCGSGLIALMLAQRYPDLKMVGMEIDKQAAVQAEENVSQSPFARRVRILAEDFFQMEKEEGSVEAIVSNPPFFEETLLSPDAQRATARHTCGGFTFPTFVAQSARLLKNEGSLQVILPATSQPVFHAACNHCGLVLFRQTFIRTVERKPPKRVLLHFQKSPRAFAVERTELVLSRDGQRSAEYAKLCADFYL